MFKRFFKPKWQHVNADIRQQAIAKLDLERPDELDILFQMARKDESTDVRRAAIDRIDALQPLVDILEAEQGSSAGLKDSLHHRISLLLCKPNNISSEEKIEILERVQEPTLFRYVVMNAQDADLQLAAVSKIVDSDTLEDLAVTAKLAKIRKIAVEHIDDAERLKRIEQQVKGKDKSVYRVAREKLALQREALEQQALAVKEATEIVEAIERHAASSVEPLYENKWQLLRKQWSALAEEQRAALAERWSLADQRCQYQIDEWQEQDYSDDIVSSDDARREQAETIVVLQDALALIKAESDPLQLDLPALQGVMSTQKVRWEKATEQFEPLESELSVYQSSQKQLRDIVDPVRRLKQKQAELKVAIEAVAELEEMSFKSLQQAQKKLKRILADHAWPSFIVKPALLQSAEVAVEQVENKAEQLKADSKEQIRAIKAGMTELESAIENGSLNDAKKCLSRLQGRLARIDDRDAETFSSKLKLLQGRVNELKDWQGFANTPKKEALIEEMTQLIDLDIDLGEKAKQIKALQDAWKALGPVEQGRSQALWKAFKEAGDRAFEPCKGYFSDQANQRKENLEKRVDLCEQLEVYESANDWAKADWKVVLETIKTAKASWRAFSPVERKLNGPVQDRFDNIVEKIQRRLDEERDRNGRLKARIIERAEALIDHGDLDEAIAKAKALQGEWKAIGLMHRKQDQMQWKSFRAACDKVFEQRQQQKSDDLASREENQRQLESICSDIQAAVVGSDDEFESSRADIKVRMAEVEQLGALPQKSAKTVRGKFTDLVKQYELRVEEIARRRLEQGYQVMWKKAELCQRLEAQLLALGEGEHLAALLSEVKADWAELGELPAAAEAALNARFDLAIQHCDNDSMEEYRLLAEKNRQTATEIVVKMEILSGIESAAGDQELRMKLQVDRLSGGLGKKQESEGALDERLDIAVQWCSLGPVEPSAFAELELRMQKAKERLNKNS